MTKRTRTLIPDGTVAVRNAVTGKTIHTEAQAQKIIEMLTEYEYFQIRYVEGWGWCGLQRFIFTVGVCHGLDNIGRKGRFCFHTLGDALAFYEEWDGSKLPVVGEDGCTAIK